MPDKLNFFSRSADKAAGKGAGEETADPARYAELAAIPHWRRVLSNFAVAPFELGGRHYRTAEHAYHARKFDCTGHPEIAASFALESGSALSRGDGLEARQARKAAVLSPAELAVWEARKSDEVAHIHEAKFTQDAAARRVLVATGDAELWHRAPRASPERWENVEHLRARLRAEHRGGPPQ
jgi:predicted NAD-dependent protein-ADP-ribosyltransferase YbiA (DUF1768 family)